MPLYNQEYQIWLSLISAAVQFSGSKCGFSVFDANSVTSFSHWIQVIKDKQIINWTDFGEYKKIINEAEVEGNDITSSLIQRLGKINDYAEKFRPLAQSIKQ